MATNVANRTRWVVSSAVGVIIGHLAWKLISQKIFRPKPQPEVNRIVGGKWKIPVICCDEHGVSGIRTDTVDLRDGGDIGHLSNTFPVKNLKFRTTPSDYNYDWHTAPRKQFIINLDAPVHITTGDGNSILLQTGQIFKVEDITGKGHKSRSVNGLPRKSIFVSYD